MAQSISCSWFLSSGVINLENAPNGLRFHMRDTRLVVKQTLQPKHPIHRYPGLRHPFGGVLNKPAVHYRDYPKGKRTAEKSAGRRSTSDWLLLYWLRCPLRSSEIKLTLT